MGNVVKKIKGGKVEKNNSQEFFVALNKVQGLIEPVKKDSTNPHFKSRYASLTAVNESVMPILLENGFTVTQGGVDIAGKPYLTTVLAHVGGHAISFVYPLVIDQNPQHTASQITYARRYSICSLLNLSVEDLDAEPVAASVRATAPKSITTKVERTYEPINDGLLTATFIPQGLKVWSGTSKKTGNPFSSLSVKDSAGNEYSTLDEKSIEILNQASEGSREVKITYIENGKYKNIKSVIFLGQVANVPF